MENEKIIIEGTSKTPGIELDFQKGKLSISGRSIPENAMQFFKPVFDGLEAYSQSPAKTTEVDLKLEYFNTSSSKSILSILKTLELLHREGKSEVKINWFYEEDDEDMLEAGEDFSVILKIPFNNIAVDVF